MAGPQAFQSLANLPEGGVDGVLLRLGAEDLSGCGQGLFIDLNGRFYHGHDDHLRLLGYQRYPIRIP